MAEAASGCNSVEQLIKDFLARPASPARYQDELTRAMDYLAHFERVLFIGQQVAVKGNAMTTTLANVPREKLLEMPVAEELQMGMSLGLALDGWVPVTVYPRWNFLLLAINQLVNHLDKMKRMSSGGYQPKVIIRVGIGSERPLNPHCQHIGDFTQAIRAMCESIDVMRLEEPEDIFPAYHHALNRSDGRSTIVVEYGDFYLEK